MNKAFVRNKARFKVLINFQSENFYFLWDMRAALYTYI